MPSHRWTSVLRAVADAVRPRQRRAGPAAVRPTRAPRADGAPDPGEVVWAWVPYEDDPSRGKDRPVLVLDRDGGTLVALMLSSQDHDRDAADEARHGRVWTDVGTGGWDPRRRPSEVRLDRVLRLRVDAVRREGAALDRDVFDHVAAAAGRLHGW
ncbi:type II toxin-antitoxin system PemK/MazF family toxin [Cellulomonas sp. NPDC057328]|uniref:type II toxin-antitoxin system PemK/MazF family toxin n=1 Tax=Cellulomonas sp. NPDC057328 TaxID=3346101 RepID=UPI0036322A9E